MKLGEKYPDSTTLIASQYTLANNHSYKSPQRAQAPGFQKSGVTITNKGDIGHVVSDRYC